MTVDHLWMEAVKAALNTKSRGPAIAKNLYAVNASMSALRGK